MSVAQTFIDSGFANALIQKKDRTDVDYSTVFYFNIVLFPSWFDLPCLLLGSLSFMRKISWRRSLGVRPGFTLSTPLGSFSRPSDVRLDFKQQPCSLFVGKWF